MPNLTIAFLSTTKPIESVVTSARELASKATKPSSIIDI